MNYIDLILLFFFYSFLGWSFEVLEGIINRRGLINRGFLVGPICPIYGICGIVMIFALKQFENNYILLFLLGMIICTVIEYVASLILEKIFHTRWWDYSDHKVHLNGRISLLTSTLFGILAVLLMRVLKPFTSYVLSILSDNIKIIVVIVSIIILLIDLLFSVTVIKRLKDKKKIKAADCTKEVNKEVKIMIKKNKGLSKTSSLIKGKKD